MLNRKIIIFTILALFIFKSSTQFFSKYFQLNKGKHYLNKCMDTVNFKRNLNRKYKNPKISVVVPVYNCEDSIKSTIASIQNQRIEEIEIILVNDFSEDNSRYIIENLKSEDSRIVIINNNQNMGTLYSRNIGAIFSNGKYIMCLDNDDMFLFFIIILKLYNIDEKYDYDIIGFKIINSIKIVIIY